MGVSLAIESCRAALRQQHQNQIDRMVWLAWTVVEHSVEGEQGVGGQQLPIRSSEHRVLRGCVRKHESGDGPLTVGPPAPGIQRDLHL